RATGTLVHGATSSASSGPVRADGTNLLLGANATGATGDLMLDAALLTSGAVNVGNNIPVSGGATGGPQATPYTLAIGGGSDNNSTFTGNVSLQNNLTVSQVATTGGHALLLSGN